MDKSVVSSSVVCLALFYGVSIIEKEQPLSFTIPVVTHSPPPPILQRAAGGVNLQVRCRLKIGDLQRV